MHKTSFESLKLKSQLEHLIKTPTLENARILKSQIQRVKNENFQLIQDVFLATLLRLMHECQGLKKNETKTVLIECMNLILAGSKLVKILPYKTLLVSLLGQVYDFNTNEAIKNTSEEMKLAVLECFNLSSKNLDPEIVEAFMVEENKVLIGQCTIYCLKMITDEAYLKIRISGIEALCSIFQVHDKSDFTDVVIRDQISKLLFFILPKITMTFVKICQEDTLKGSQLIQSATKFLGRFLCLIFEDYDKRNHQLTIKNEDFDNLIAKQIKNVENNDVLNLKHSQSTSEYLSKLNKTHEWLRAAWQKIHPILIQIKILRGNEYNSVREELLQLSVNLIQKCKVNITESITFLLENLLTLCDDPDDNIRTQAKSFVEELLKNDSELNQEISNLFNIHLTSMPRIIMTGDESEQIAAFRMLNSLVIADQKNFSKNSTLLDRFMNIMLNCCEIEVPNELLFYENLSCNELEDNFYQLKSPWKKFKHLKNQEIMNKFSEICKNLGEFDSSEIYINFLLDNLESLEFLVLLIEILKHTRLERYLLEEIVDEFLKEDYWTMPIIPQLTQTTKQSQHDEWFKESVPGLFESAVEVRLQNISLNDEVVKSSNESNLKSIKYNILSTCFVLQLIGVSASLLQKRFQIYILKTLHRVLQKAGSSNLLIRLAGLCSLEMITKALEFSTIQELIDDNSEALLFNIHNSLKKDQNNESVIDILSVIFKFSKKSMVGYIEDIVESVDEQIMNQRFNKNTLNYLKLFRLYSIALKSNEILKNDQEIDEICESSWDEFFDQCSYELDKKSGNEDENLEDIKTDKVVNDEESHEENQEVQKEVKEDKVELPDQIKLVIRILKTSLQFFSSKNSQEVILTHEIFIDSLPILSNFENEFLPMIHEMWYPFTKQFQIQNLVVLQRSLHLLVLIINLAKDFVYKKSTDDVFPQLDKFLNFSLKKVHSKENLSYTQEFKLLVEVLENYGKMAIVLNIDEKQLDKIVDLLLKFEKSSSQKLSEASKISLNAMKKGNPGLLAFKRKFN